MILPHLPEGKNTSLGGRPLPFHPILYLESSVLSPRGGGGGGVSNTAARSLRTFKIMARALQSQGLGVPLSGWGVPFRRRGAGGSAGGTQEYLSGRELSSLPGVGGGERPSICEFYLP